MFQQGGDPTKCKTNVSMADRKYLCWGGNRVVSGRTQLLEPSGHLRRFQVHVCLHGSRTLLGFFLELASCFASLFTVRCPCFGDMEGALKKPPSHDGGIVVDC
jgi:hypothetical protein